MRNLFSRLLGIGACTLCAAPVRSEPLALQVLSYDQFMQEDPETLRSLQEALHHDGIVGIRGVPGYAEKMTQFIEEARLFTALPEDVKEQYAPNRERGDLFLGYQTGKEKFKRPDGKWVVDDLKVSYYAFVPDHPHNLWPIETALQRSYLELGNLLSVMGKAVMEKIGLTGESTGVFLGDMPQVGRLLYYQKSGDTRSHNPYWCGAHFDNGLFTAITPALYFLEGGQIEEPEEAGLFVNVRGEFKKVVADPAILMFQVGEFAQLATNDAIRATEHRVEKASGAVERYAMALFFIAPMDTTIRSTSILTQDARYGGEAGTACTYQRWHEESFKRYIVKDDTD